ncbi:MAG: asparagine synthase (glutamine-hydrolyzing) [Sulfurovum sp.]
MCAILGLLTSQKKEKNFHSMSKIQSHRGEDDRGVWIEKIKDTYVHLGHNRLSIQDLSSLGHQPFISDCGEIVIVFNGEVYNFKSIRVELEALGYSFTSHSDTEVIIYAYKAWGIECLDKFIGMFAISILDKIKQKMFLIRDRAGVKPLYYYVGSDDFMFASELKAFHGYNGYKKEKNISVLPYYFQFGYIPSPHTIFENTYKLPTGSYLEYDITNSSYIIEKYWCIDEAYSKEKFTQSEEEIKNELENLLIDAVELRMVSDVPVGVFLSGGYDSSLVTALLSQNSDRKLHTYTIGFEDSRYDEAKYAKEIAKHLGTEHNEYYLSPKDMLNLVESLPFYYNEPFGDSSALPTILVSQKAQVNLKVILSADGGDEVFCGYSKYFFLDKFAPILSRPFLKRILGSGLDIMSPQTIAKINSKLPKSLKQTNIEDKYLKFKRAVKSANLEEAFINASSYVEAERVREFIKIANQESYYINFQMDKNLSAIDNMMRADYKSFMVDDILTKVDRATMSVGLEGREPLLDHRIAEFMARVPKEIKYKNNQGKYLARKILYKHIPKHLLDRPKAGFQVPLESWLKGELKPLVDKYLDIYKLDKEIFEPQKVAQIKKEFFAGDSSHTSTIWFILSYQMWEEMWFG